MMRKVSHVCFEFNHVNSWTSNPYDLHITIMPRRPQVHVSSIMRKADFLPMRKIQRCRSAVQYLHNYMTVISTLFSLQR